MNAIEINGLSKKYSNFSDFELKKFSLTLPSGSILGLVGENGAGKSTTINLIMNTVARNSGTIKVLGTDNTSKEFSATKEDIGVVLDEAYFPEVLTAKNVGSIMQKTYKNWDSDVYNRYINKFSLPFNKMFKDFSRGMKMKLAIAVALSHDPKLLILDEATSGLDPMIRDEILDIFNEFTRNENHSIILSSHIVSDLEKICDYIAFIHKGELLFCEEKDVLLEEYGIIKLGSAEFENLPKAAVLNWKKQSYGVEALVKKSLLPSSVMTEHTSLEDIIVLLAKGEKK